MSIRRSAFAFERDFTRIPNEWVRDRRLSRRARGLLAELMSHALGWRTTVASLAENGPEGRDAIRSALAELRECGYLTLMVRQAAGGRLDGQDYVLTDPTALRESRRADGPQDGSSPPKKNKIKKTSPGEDQESATSVAPFASSKQRTFLRDCRLLLGSAVAVSDLARLTSDEAAAEIRGLWSQVEGLPDSMLEDAREQFAADLSPRALAFIDARLHAGRDAGGAWLKEVS